MIKRFFFNRISLGRAGQKAVIKAEKLTLLVQASQTEADLVWVNLTVTLAGQTADLVFAKFFKKESLFHFLIDFNKLRLRIKRSRLSVS